MTYRRLADIIQTEFSDEQKDMDLTVYDAEIDEYFMVQNLWFTGKEPDVLDPHHPVLVFKKEEDQETT